MVDYSNAIKRPFTDFKKLLIGCALSIIPIVNLFASGYGLLCAKTAMSRKKELPEWDNWGDLFIKGVLAAVIGLIYFIPTIILAVIALGAGITTALATKNIFATLAAAGPLMLVTGIVGLITMYIAPNAMLGYVSSWSFGDGFKLGEVLKKSLRGNYFVAWSLAAIISIIAMIVFGLIPIVGYAIGNFISAVIALTILGEAYAQK